MTTQRAVHPYQIHRSFVSPLADEFDDDHQALRHAWVQRQVEAGINALLHANGLLMADPVDMNRVVAALRLGTWCAVMAELEVSLHPPAPDTPAA